MGVRVVVELQPALMASFLAVNAEYYWEYASLETVTSFAT